MNPPEIKPQDSSDLEDTERTEKELYDILATGSTVEVFPGENLSFQVSISDVVVWVRMPIDEQDVADLAAGLPRQMRLALPPIDQVLDGTGESDGAEMGLLERVLAARARLLGTTPRSL